MPKVNRPGSQKSGTNSNTLQETDTNKKPASQQSQAQSPTPKTAPAQSSGSQAARSKSKSGARNRKPAIGGTAIAGAKSTLPKEVKPGTPAEQQAESYNREMRRRMQHMGTGPYSAGPADSLRERRKKRQEEKKKRQEQVKKEVVTRGPSTNVRLGNRNTYFLIGTVAVIVLIIIIAIIVRHPF
jgi:hypothetical protein